MGSGRCDLDGDGNVDVDVVLEVSWNPQGWPPAFASWPSWQPN